MTLRLTHVMIHVRDLDRAIGFYTRVFGLDVVDRHVYDGASLAYLRGPGDSFEIELLCETGRRFAAAPEKGRSHIAFSCVDVAAERQRIEALGTSCGPVRPYAANGRIQTRYFYLYDPDGNEIEILESMGRYRAQGNSHDAP